MKEEDAMTQKEGVLTGLYPSKVFGFFEEICAVPRVSGDARRFSIYLKEFAKARQLPVEIDAHYNVIIRKPATTGYENEPTLILQAHADMVAVTTPNSRRRIKVDGVEPWIDGEYVRAKDTTLGADDGIGVAYIMAILDDNSLAHPSLEAVFTVGEETGMTGVRTMQMNALTGTRLINLDHEEEGALLTSCAGGLSIQVYIPIKYRKRRGSLYELTVTGATGGHSGLDIFRGGANAIQLLGQFLWQLYQLYKVSIVDIKGGTVDNAIPREASATLIIPKYKVGAIQKCLRNLIKEYVDEYLDTDPDMQVALTPLHKTQRKPCLNTNAAIRITDYLRDVPNGVREGAVDRGSENQTSLNMGVIYMTEDSAWVHHNIRSTSSQRKEKLCGAVYVYAVRAQGDLYEINEYQEWVAKEDSLMRAKMIEVYDEMYHMIPKIASVHAGVECAVFAQKREDTDCISIGPTMENVHTTEERLHIPSVGKTYDFLVKVLEYKDSQLSRVDSPIIKTDLVGKEPHEDCPHDDEGGMGR
ncbi:MAG: beta-Ala-His dipeptidase [Clostridium sp.]|jgi:dipeptidase D|nr:beta-Ala-His dipeptidase [Clostridium sp.]